MRVFDAASRASAIEIEQLVADYWYDVDRLESRNAPDFFTEHGVFDPGIGRVFEGREGVRAFYEMRAARAQRTARHCCSNLRVTFETPSRARVDYIVTLYGADGPPPIADLAGPGVVADVTSVCERDADGRWRFALVESRGVFIGAEPYIRQGFSKA